MSESLPRVLCLVYPTFFPPLMWDKPAPIRDAPAPFSGAPDPEKVRSDFILRSSDGVDFHVQKDMLKAVSDFFDGIFSLPPGNYDPNELRRDGKPGLVLRQPSAVLYGLLSLVYPAQSFGQYEFGTDDFDEIVAIHDAAYEYQFTGVQRLMKEMLKSPDLLDAHAHRLFAIARLRELPELARAAALYTLKSPVCPAAPEFPEMKLLTWADAHELYDFHHSCGLGAQTIAQSYETFPTHDEDTKEPFLWWLVGHDDQCGPWQRRQDGRYEGINNVPIEWFRNHLARLAVQLRALPTGHTVEMEALNIAPAERAIIDACYACSRHADKDLASFARQLAAKIEASNDKLGEEFSSKRYVSRVSIGIRLPPAYTVASRWHDTIRPQS
ncbi:hypothetical protein DFH09DRAFT_1148490 [Mycena vulgaris]|nr:hypothetical protein DFH09DRAFT_1148490 [Mycena vulgaris]